MATVIYVPQDRRTDLIGEGLGQGVGSYAEAYQHRQTQVKQGQAVQDLAGKLSRGEVNPTQAIGALVAAGMDPDQATKTLKDNLEAASYARQLQGQLQVVGAQGTQERLTEGQSSGHAMERLNVQEGGENLRTRETLANQMGIAKLGSQTDLAVEGSRAATARDTTFSTNRERAFEAGLSASTDVYKHDSTLKEGRYEFDKNAEQTDRRQWRDISAKVAMHDADLASAKEISGNEIAGRLATTNAQVKGSLQNTVLDGIIKGGLQKDEHGFLRDQQGRQITAEEQQQAAQRMSQEGISDKEIAARLSIAREGEAGATFRTRLGGSIQQGLQEGQQGFESDQQAKRIASTEGMASQAERGQNTRFGIGTAADLKKSADGIAAQIMMNMQDNKSREGIAARGDQTQTDIAAKGQAAETFRAQLSGEIQKYLQSSGQSFEGTQQEQRLKSAEGIAANAQTGETQRTREGIQGENARTSATIAANVFAAMKGDASHEKIAAMGEDRSDRRTQAELQLRSDEGAANRQAAASNVDAKNATALQIAAQKQKDAAAKAGQPGKPTDTDKRVEATASTLGLDTKDPKQMQYARMYDSNKKAASALIASTYGKTEKIGNGDFSFQPKGAEEAAKNILANVAMDHIAREVGQTGKGDLTAGGLAQKALQQAEDMFQQPSTWIPKSYLDSGARPTIGYLRDTLHFDSGALTRFAKRSYKSLDEGQLKQLLGADYAPEKAPEQAAK